MSRFCGSIIYGYDKWTHSVIDEISTHIVHTYAYIMRGKLRHFTRCSLPRYALASLIVTVGVLMTRSTSITAVQILIRVLVVFGAMALVAMVALYVSAALQARRHTATTIVFRPHTIVIRLPQSSSQLTADYAWVGSVRKSATGLVITRQANPPLYIFLDRPQMTDGEIQQLEQWLMANGKM
jgi:hypothetical protein